MSLAYLAVVPDKEYSDVTIAALEKSRAAFPLPVIYICPSDCFVPSNLNYKVIHVNIDYKDYSEWMIKELYKYIDTDHVITIQYDSCVINSVLWTQDFLLFDYVAAPWPNNWVNRVGCGGCSIRSRKLIEICSTLPYNKTGNQILDNEDYHFCVTNYGLLCNKGVKFAPVDLARKFCVEHPIPEKWHDYNDLSTYDSFAFHGTFNKAGMKFIGGEAS